MTKNWSGNGKSTFITIGASNHTDKEREEILEELNRTANGNCEWRPVPNYEHRFLISSDGQVFSLFSKRIMKLETLPNGYIYLPIMEQRPKRHVVTAYIHRLVAITFIPNEQNKTTVNHIDGDKKKRIITFAILNGQLSQSKTFTPVGCLDASGIQQKSSREARAGES